MKNILFIILALFITSNSYAKKVQFSVSMVGQTKSALGIHLMSDFQAMKGWGNNFEPSDSCLMIQDAVDTNLFHFVVDLPAFNKYEYIFVNGDQYEVETIPFASQVDSNTNEHRWIYVDSLDADTMKLAHVIFDENSPAGLPMIRFAIDMSKEIVSPNGIHVAGNFQSNNPATHRMYSFGNNRYEIMCYKVPGNYTYKFYNGNTLINTETVPSTCATAGDRTINHTGDIYLNAVCFSECSTCFPLFVPSIIEVNFRMYPNPMTESSIVEFANENELHHVFVFDLTGREVMKQINIREPNYTIKHLFLSTGIFSVVVIDESGNRISQKLIVE